MYFEKVFKTFKLWSKCYSKELSIIYCSLRSKSLMVKLTTFLASSKSTGTGATKKFVSQIS